MTRIVCTSDFHGTLPVIPECDLLLITGDICPDYFHRNTAHYTSEPLPEKQGEWLKNEFAEWLEQVPAKEKVGILGNHDFIGEHDPELVYSLPWTYLCDETTTVDGLTIHGSPYSPKFGRDWAYMKTDAQLSPHWDLIPKDVDILLVHGPVYGYGDIVRYLYGYERDPHQGSQTLRNRLMYGNFEYLKLVASGHIHEAYGESTLELVYPDHDHVQRVQMVNSSYVTLEYDPQNQPIEMELT